jgi:hypothetical protein
MIQSNRFGRKQVGGSVDSTIHFTHKGKTMVAEPRHITNDERARIAQLFQLADLQLVYSSPVGHIREEMRSIVKSAEANIRSIGKEGGERFQTVKSDLEYALVLNEDDQPSKRPPANLVYAVAAILHG